MMHRKRIPIKAGRGPRPGATTPDGVPTDRREQFLHLIGLARTRHAAGWTREEIVRDLLAVNDQLEAPLPSFSAGGLIDCINEIVGGPPVPHARLLTFHLRPCRPRSKRCLAPTSDSGRLTLCLIPLCPRCGRPLAAGGVA
jgi:hypothetical protein